MPNAKYHTLRKTLFCCAFYTMPYALFTGAMHYALYPMRSALCTVRYVLHTLPYAKQSYVLVHYYIAIYYAELCTTTLYALC